MEKAQGIQNANSTMLSCPQAACCSPGSLSMREYFWSRTLLLRSAGMAKAGVPTLALVATIGLQLVAGIAIAVGGIHV